jgi:hypothetical protein
VQEITHKLVLTAQATSPSLQTTVSYSLLIQFWDTWFLRSLTQTCRSCDILYSRNYNWVSPQQKQFWIATHSLFITGHAVFSDNKSNNNDSTMKHKYSYLRTLKFSSRDRESHSKRYTKQEKSNRKWCYPCAPHRGCISRTDRTSKSAMSGQSAVSCDSAVTTASRGISNARSCYQALTDEEGKRWEDLVCATLVSWLQFSECW